MKYLASAKQLTISSTLFIITTLLLFTGCQKKEIINNDLTVDYTENFFTVPNNVNPIIKRVANALSKQNDLYHFVNDLAKHEGMAFWSNSFILQGDSFLHRDANTATGTDTTVLIPLVLSNTQYVSGYLECKVTDSVQIALVKGREYNSYGYNTTDTILNAQTIAKVCMAFEYEIWGHDKFVIINATLGRSLFELAATPLYQVITIKPATIAGRTQAVGHFHYEYTMEEFQQDLQNNYTAWWYAQGYNNVNGGGGGNVYPPSGVGGNPAGNSGTGGWYSYPYSGYSHWNSGWQITMEDGQKVNNFRLNNIDMSGLDSCRKLILQKLLTINGTNPLGRILTKIDRGINEPLNIEKFKVTYQMKPLNPGVVASTGTYVYNNATQTFSAIITLDSAKAVDGTDLFVAGSFLHETMHAYFASLMYRIKNNVTLASLQAMSYDSLFNEYVDSLVARGPALLNEVIQSPQFHHNFWTSKILTKFAEALQMFDNNTMPDLRYYWYLSWKGLFNTRTWQQHWNNFPNLPVTGLYTTEDSTRGLLLALTPIRIDSVNRIIRNEMLANAASKGKKPIAGGCY
jgi:hypothetical protein